MDLDPTKWDESSGSGIICKICGVLVARVGDYPLQHLEWHEQLGG